MKDFRRGHNFLISCQPAGGPGGLAGSTIEEHHMLSDMSENGILVFGCGNTLLGDDGFGPAVAERLNGDHRLPSHVLALDVGTSVRELLLDLLISEKKPAKIFIVDAVDQSGRAPGEIFEIEVHEISEKKIPDFSMHQFPSMNLLKELQESSGIDLKILVAQVQEIPDEVRPGLTPAVEEAVARACERILLNI
jgi:coenzyme F420 hydrogenase subunit delta